MATVAPTNSPTFGPPATKVVNTILLSTISGIVFILIMYFWAGYYLYNSEIEQRLKTDNLDITCDVPSDNEERSLLLKGDQTHLL